MSNLPPKNYADLAGITSDQKIAIDLRPVVKKNHPKRPKQKPVLGKRKSEIPVDEAVLYSNSKMQKTNSTPERHYSPIKIVLEMEIDSNKENAPLANSNVKNISEACGSIQRTPRDK
jgi:hypothetical protein